MFLTIIMKILISGSLAYDFVMDFPDSFKNHIMPDSIHMLNVCFMIDKLNKGWGGTAGNIAYNFSLLGTEPEVVSAIGKDGKEYLAHLEKCGIGTKQIVHDEERFTSSAYITTDKDDNQITAFYNGPLGLAQEKNLGLIEGDYRLAIIAPTQKEVMIKHLKEAKEKIIETVFDPGQQITALLYGRHAEAVRNDNTYAKIQLLNGLDLLGTGPEVQSRSGLFWLGWAFVLMCPGIMVAGIPLGRLADTWSRKRLLAMGTAVWAGLIRRKLCWMQRSLVPDQ